MQYFNYKTYHIIVVANTHEDYTDIRNWRLLHYQFSSDQECFDVISQNYQFIASITDDELNLLATSTCYTAENEMQEKIYKFYKEYINERFC